MESTLFRLVFCECDNAASCFGSCALMQLEKTFGAIESVLCVTFLRMFERKNVECYLDLDAV